MKKLTLALVAAAAVLSVNAATVDWQIQITGATAADAYQTGYMAYLVNASAWDNATITAATFSDPSIVLDSTVFNSGTGKSTKTYTTIASGATIGARAVDVASLDVGNALDVYYVILNGNADPNTYTAISDTLTGRSATGETALGLNFQPPCRRPPLAPSRGVARSWRGMRGAWCGVPGAWFEVGGRGSFRQDSQD